MQNLYQVNWVNGMKIAATHFAEAENHFIHRIQHSIQAGLTPFSYGLFSNGETELPRFNISFNENKIRSLSAFSAITPEGFLIEIPANMEFSFGRPTTEASSYFLVVSVKPFERVPYGQLNEDESPLRFPQSIPEYHFQLVSRDAKVIHTLGDCVVPLGKYSRSNFEEDKSYLPPCSSVRSHPTLVATYNAISAMMNDLEKRVFEGLSEQNVGNRMMLLNLVNFFNTHKVEFDWKLLYLPPIHLFELMNKLARIILYSSSVQNVHFNDQLTSLLQSLINNKYDHLDAGIGLPAIKQFTENYTKFLPKQDNIFGV
jgi:hypothetical protein